jgi:hypothetical protein
MIIAGNCVGYSVWTAVIVHSTSDPTAATDVPTAYAAATSSTAS